MWTWLWGRYDVLQSVFLAVVVVVVIFNWTELNITSCVLWLIVSWIPNYKTHWKWSTSRWTLLCQRLAAALTMHTTRGYRLHIDCLAKHRQLSQRFFIARTNCSHSNVIRTYYSESFMCILLHENFYVILFSYLTSKLQCKFCICYSVWLSPFFLCLCLSVCLSVSVFTGMCMCVCVCMFFCVSV